MAQRLVRTLCNHCKETQPTDPEQWERLIHPFKSKMPETVCVPVGCNECRNKGFVGRQGVYELMAITPGIRRIILEGAELSELRKEAVKDGMHTLRLSGALKVASGSTSIEEVLRVTPYNEL